MKREKKEAIALEKTINNKICNRWEKIVGFNIAKYRIAFGISREELSELVNIGDNQLLRYECGTSRVSSGHLFLIAGALLLKPEEFFSVNTRVFNE